MIGQLLKFRRRYFTFVRRVFGRYVNMHPTAFIAKRTNIAKDIVMKEHSFINIGCYVTAGTTLGRYTMLGPNVSIVGGDHRFDVPGVPTIFAGRPDPVETIIEDDVWIGCGAVVIAGIRIGRGAIVAAGAVVTKDVEPYNVVAGVPAKTVRPRFENEEQVQEHEKLLNGPTISRDYCLPKTMIQSQTRETENKS